MPNHSYAREKLGLAVDTLATGNGRLTQRIQDAYLGFHTLTPEDFESDEDQERYRSVMDRLTTVKDGDADKGYVQNTLAAMDDETARAIAEDLVALNHSVRR